MYFDIAMPLALLAVTLVSLFINKKTESKLKETLEDRKISVWDVVLLVSLMAVMVYLIVFVRQMTVILMAMFLFAYSMLLFTFSYMFSKKRWYLAVLPPAVFLLLYLFVRETPLWNLYLVNMYGLVFAVLITLYMASLFSWKTTAVFGVLITAMDVVLVFVTRTMVEAAKATTGLGLPVMVSLPLVPLLFNEDGLLLMMSLGLGDFFFSGLLGIQTYRRYGRRFAIITAVGIMVSFFLFEFLLLNYLRMPFAGTVMIICGWAPLVLWKEYSRRKEKASESSLVKIG